MEKTSAGVEAFLDYLRDASERQRMAEADRTEAEAATQDLLHALELGQLDRAERARLAVKLREVRRKRRRAKNTLAWTTPVAAWAKENHGTVKSLERLLGELRKVERQSEGRVYAPRTHVLEELNGKGGPA